MKTKIFYLLTTLMMLVLTACGSPSSTEGPQVNDQQAFPTLDAPSGTVIENNTSGMVLSHPDFAWTFTLPADWQVTYDAGYQVNANSADKTIFVRLQAQRWREAVDRIPNARAYVEHWENFSHGNIFPMFADGTKISETEIGRDKIGGPYLQFEFDDSNKQVRYLQVYASAGGPTSAMITTWALYGDYDSAQKTMQEIIDSFELLENAQ